VERWLVEAVVPAGLPALATAEEYGVVVLGPERVAFRHELMRRSIVDSMPVGRRVAANRSILDALLQAEHTVDVSRIVHHAAEAGDQQTVVWYGPAAAREAISAGSHTEAVAHYRRLADCRAAFPPKERAELLEAYAIECYTTGLTDETVEAQRDVVRLRRDLGDRAALGRSWRWLSRMHWWAGQRAEADAAGAEATAILADAGDPGALALALSNESQLHMLSGRWTESIASGLRAVGMARELHDAAILSHALTNVGASLWNEDPVRGEAILTEGLGVALAADEGEHACRTYVALVWNFTEALRLVEAQRVVTEAMEYADERELLGFLRYFKVEQSMITLARGDWPEAERQADGAFDAEPVVRLPALVVLGRLRARRGAAGAAEPLAEAWQLALRLDEVQRVAPVASAMLEAGWLSDDGGSTAVATVQPWADRIREHGTIAARAEFAYWLWRCGARPAADAGAADHPYALLAAGRWREAAQEWQRGGLPYEQSLALSDSDDPTDLLTALATVDALGGEPLARRLRQRLRDLGVTRLPRGPAPATRANPAHLTGRQVEVVRLLADGLTNAEIAARLVLSVRTVDAHVAAVFDKLETSTRLEAVGRARELGLVD
jgi:DNA-binding CsgD family transcriptional regulator